METKNKKSTKKSGKSTFSTVLYTASVVVVLIGATLLFLNVSLYSKTVKDYVAQGYPLATVVGQLLPGQLLPGIFEPVALYGGMALVLFGIGKVNKKVSKYFEQLPETEISDEALEESALEENVVVVENTETPEHKEVVEESAE